MTQGIRETANIGKGLSMVAPMGSFVVPLVSHRVSVVAAGLSAVLTGRNLISTFALESAPTA